MANSDDQVSNKKQDLPIMIANITPANIQQLKSINIATLPVRYTDKFYNDLLVQWGSEYMQYAIWHGFNIAAVCARVEKHDVKEGFSRLYIMTINVLPAYRRKKIASRLLNYVLDLAKKDEKIIEAYLHVQVTNNDAKQLYLSHGFEQTDYVKDYYKRIDNPHSFLLKKSLIEGHVVESTVDKVHVENTNSSHNDENNILIA